MIKWQTTHTLYPELLVPVVKVALWGPTIQGKVSRYRRKERLERSFSKPTTDFWEAQTRRRLAQAKERIKALLALLALLGIVDSARRT